FGRDRAVAHRAGGEPLDDRLDRLDLLDRDRSAILELEAEEAAERTLALALVVHHPGVLLENLVAAAPRGVLGAEDGRGVEEVELAITAPLVLTAFLKDRRSDLARRIGAALMINGPLVHLL